MSEIEKGGISVQTEHIFPIIKKWLYSEKEIFLREIVSNSVDAITKLRRRSSLGEADFASENFRVDVTVDKDAKTLTVSDNGIGMTPEVKEKIYQNFFTTKPLGQGTGLGMSITRNIINQHNGRIEFDSVEHSGTCFTLIIPILKK